MTTPLTPETIRRIEEAKSCPFCGFTGRISIQQVKTTSPAFFYHAGHCIRCGAKGPLGYTSEEGARCWNARMAPLDSEDTENGNPFLERPEARDSVRHGDPRYWPTELAQSQGEGKSEGIVTEFQEEANRLDQDSRYTPEYRLHKKGEIFDALLRNAQSLESQLSALKAELELQIEALEVVQKEHVDTISQLRSELEQASAEREELLARNQETQSLGHLDHDTIEDGFGMVCSAWCPTCHEKTMEVVRPGKVQCSNCG